MVCFIPPANWKLRWIGRFFGKYSPAKIIQEETDNLNILSSKEIIPNCFSHIRLFATPWTIYSPWNSTGQNTGVGSLSLLQGIFPTQGSNPGLPHCRWILYQLSHKGSPRILEWVASLFSRGSSWPRNQTGISYIAGKILYQLSYQGSPFNT